MLLLLVVMVSTLALGRDEQSCGLRIDAKMGSQRLGTVPAKPFGRLVVDGDGDCDLFPHSACAYSDGKYNYYYHDGRLISKTFEFSPTAPKGPFGLRRNDSPAEVVKKLSRHVCGQEPRRVGNSIFYYFECGPRWCRLDVEITETETRSVSLRYPDAI